MAAIICCGIAVRDLVFDVPFIPSVPRKLTASALHRRGGGMAATAAVAAAALGGEAEYWGRLGDDETGRDLRHELESHGVRVHAHIVPGSETPIAAVFVAENGERLLAFFRGTLDDDASGLPLERVRNVQAVHADFRWPAGARALFLAAREHGLPRVLDADAGGAAVTRGLLPLVDHAIFSEGALAELAGTTEVEAGLRHAAGLTPGVAAVTLGERGSVFLVDGTVHRVGAPAIRARDTNGAGDVFHGAYALALAEGRGVLEAARFATAVGALKCANGSGWEAAPDRAAVNEFLKGNDW